MPTLSEADSKALLGRYGVAVPREEVVSSPGGAASAAARIGYPVAAKLCGPGIAHKTERGLVRLALRDAAAVSAAAAALLAEATPDDGPVSVLISQMVRGTRELIAGALTDPQFGPSVMLGVGGVLAEAVGDVVFRLAPLSLVDASEMIDELPSALLGPARGEPGVDREALASTVIALGRLVVSDALVRSVDCNPLVVGPGGLPIAVDALVEVAPE